MTEKELKELKRLSMFFCKKAERIEKNTENQLKGVNVIEYNRRRTEVNTFKYVSTLLAIKLESLNGNGKRRVRINLNV